MSKKMKRPWWCQDPDCMPDYIDAGARTSDAAQTGWCCGRTSEKLIVIRKKVTHENDGHFCTRTAIRGVVMLEVNKIDLMIMSQVLLHSLVKREPDKPFNFPWFTGRYSDA